MSHIETMEEGQTSTVDSASTPEASTDQPSASDIAGEKPQSITASSSISESASKNLLDNLVCPICLDLFSDAVVLNCGHTYCFRCISLHMQRHDNCPADRILITLITKNMAVRQVIDIVRPNHNTNSREANDPAMTIQMGYIPPLPPGEVGPEPAMNPADVPPDVQIAPHLLENHPVDGIDLTNMRKNTKLGVFASTATLFLISAGLEQFGGKSHPSLFGFTWNPIANGIVSALGGFFMAAATEGFLEDMIEPHMKPSVENGRFRFFAWLFVHAPTIFLANHALSYRMVAIPPLVYLEIAALRGMFGWNHTFSRASLPIVALVSICSALTWKILP